MGQRLREIDIIRAIAALAVIFIHVSGYQLTPHDAKISNAVFILNQAARFSVPLFLILSGYALHYTYKNGRKFQWMTYVKRRLVRVLIPYVLWTLIYVLYALRNDWGLILSDKTGFIVFLGEQLFNGTAALHLYFILIIIQMYFLYPLLRALIRRRPYAVLAASFTLSVFSQAIAYVKLIHPGFLAQLNPQFQMLFPAWLFYFVFGMYLSDSLQSMANKLPTSAILLSAWIIGLVVVVANSLATGTYSSSIKPDIILYSIASFVLFYSLLKKAKGFQALPGRFLIWFSRQSYAAYLSHILFLEFYLSVVGSAYKRFFSSLTGVLFVYALTVITTSVFICVMGFTPLAPLLGGIRNDKND